MPPAEFEPATERPQTYALDRDRLNKNYEAKRLISQLRNSVLVKVSGSWLVRSV